MAQALREAERLESLENICLGILCETGAVKECEQHLGCGYYIDQEDSDAVNHAYAKTTLLFQKKDAQMKDFRSLKELRQAMKNAYEDKTMQECPGCQAREKD
ncbi:MAG: hypothetical protein PHC61_03935 [Chitinivibrionales bacterium]|nr:hypothetical protein [Chitinivibrionales bacterium]